MPEVKSPSDAPQRRSIRIGGYDYSQPGAYFLTACAHNRESLFGEVLQGNMRLSHLGEIVQEEWAYSGRIRDELTLDSFVVMPNHIHGIVIIDLVGATGWSPVGEGPRSGRATSRSRRTEQVTAGTRSGETISRGICCRLQIRGDQAH